MNYEIIEEYGCGHEFFTHTKCKDEWAKCQVRSNNRQFRIKPAKEGIIMRLFRSSSPSKKDSQPAARYRRMDSICGICHSKEAEKRAAPQYQPPYDFAEAMARQVSNAAKAIGVGRDQFLCTKCTSEGRPVAHASQRAANSGLCCEYGRKEFERHCKLAKSGKHSPLPPLTDTRPHTAGPAAPAVLTHTNSEPGHRSPRSVIVAAREASDHASQGYGWSQVKAPPVGLFNPTTEKKKARGGGFDPGRYKRERLIRLYTTQKLGELSLLNGVPDPPTPRREKKEEQAVGYEPEGGKLQFRNRDPIHLEPKRGYDSSNLPGYMLPEQKTEQGTYHLEPQIQLDRWGDHPQTNHGRIPMAPRRALPHTPQKDKDELLPQTPEPSSNTRSTPKAPRKPRQPMRSHSFTSNLQTPTRERSRPPDRAYQTQAETHQPPSDSLLMRKPSAKAHGPLDIQPSSSKAEPPALLRSRSINQTYQPQAEIPRSQSHSSSAPKISKKSQEPLGVQASSSKPHQSPSRERPKERINQTQAERLHPFTPRPQVHVPPKTLQSKQGKEWYGKKALEELRSQHPQDTTSFSHRLSGPFLYQPYLPDVEGQDMPASTSRLLSQATYSPVSPLDASRFQDEIEIAPLSMAKRNASFRERMLEQTGRMGCRDVTDKSFEEAYEAVWYWESEVKRGPNPKKR